ncbi:MAG: M42 family metallopeptidase [Candidatus Bipolaricaulaceae bacterium]
MDLLRRLSEVPGVPGREEGVRAVVREALLGQVDEIRVDRLGNLIARKAGEGPKVVVAAHMDEIGFFVSHVDGEKGFLRMEPVGGFDPRTLIAKRVTVHTEQGPLIGLVGTKPIHILTEDERKKELKIKDLYIDLGLGGEEVQARVQIGDPVTLHQQFTEVGELVSGKALDDRVGVYVGVEVMRRLSEHRADVYFVGTVQEEVGLRGAQASAFAIAPEIAVALDVTLACDIPGAQPHEQVTALGKGVAIKVKDSSSISHPGLVRFLVQLAKQADIPYQMEILPRGGTDAGAMQLAREGAAAVTLSIPTRYVHSAVEAAHKRDIQATIDLLVSFLQRCHQLDLRL